jgi:hypothetical protein
VGTEERVGGEEVRREGERRVIYWLGESKDRVETVRMEEIRSE